MDTSGSRVKPKHPVGAAKRHSLENLLQTYSDVDLSRVRTDILSMSNRRAQMRNLLKLVSGKVGKEIKSDTGATAVEYALIVGLIAVVIIIAVAFLGDTISGIFEDVGSEISSRT